MRHLKGPTVSLRAFELADAATLAEIQTINRQRFRDYMPSREESFLTVEGQRNQILSDQQAWDNARGFAYAVCLGETIIGRVALSNVVRASWQSATLGYWVDMRYQGLGYATEAVQGALWFAFEEAQLHRVQAAIMPKNEPSLRVIKKSGFIHEGYAPYYLNIAGRWEGHEIFSITRERYEGQVGWRVSPLSTAY